MKKTKTLKYLFIPDTHVPYHDQGAFALMLSVARSYKPDVVVILGDFLDCATVSRHIVDPSSALSLDEELSRGNYAMDQIDELGVKKKIYLEGNHEKRLPNLILGLSPEMRQQARRVDISVQLDLPKRGWDFHFYREHIKLASRFYVTHDFGAAGKNAILNAGVTYGSNVIFGHTHRLGAVYDGDIEHGTRVAINAGHLADPAYATYMPKVKLKDWQQGFVLAEVEPSTGFVYAWPIPILSKAGKKYAYVLGESFSS